MVSELPPTERLDAALPGVTFYTTEDAKPRLWGEIVIELDSRATYAARAAEVGDEQALAEIVDRVRTAAIAAFGLEPVIEARAAAARAEGHTAGVAEGVQQGEDAILARLARAVENTPAETPRSMPDTIGDYVPVDAYTLEEPTFRSCPDCGGSGGGTGITGADQDRGLCVTCHGAGVVS